MKYSLLAALFLTFPASADLYRWIDRESGSVKFSNTPPPWFGDPEREQIEAYQALSTELDRLDPAGTPRRRAQEASAFRK